MGILKRLFVYLFRKGKGALESSGVEETRKKEQAVEIREVQKNPSECTDNIAKDYEKERYNKELENKRIELRRKLWDLEKKINLEDLPKDNALENEVIRALRDIKNKESKVLWNVYPEAKNATLSQVDVIYVTSHKIYVIECKDYKNCIGMQESKDKKRCKCKYESGEYDKCSPIYQNRGHIWTLKSYLDIPEEFFESIVVIVTADNIRNIIKSDEAINLKNSRRNELKSRLEERVDKGKRILSDKDMLRVGTKLLEAMNPSKETVDRHRKCVNEKIQRSMD
ncbi:MAG: nuclease-related domain-containing protein [Clostridium sp.]|uniref:nuclease-related domain-containing protein n=1 Tax=Clostridium sp. TaxID=1506 RepID=UPI003F3AB41B